MTVGRVRKHLLQEGKAEHWMIFEELALAPLIPGRTAKSREEILAMFPGEGPAFLDNRMTTVKRVFRRILPALIPVDPTESRTPEQRFGELLEILRASANSRLWLAFLVDRPPTPRSRAARRSTWRPGTIGGEGDAASVSPDILHDELRISWASGWRGRCKTTSMTSRRAPPPSRGRSARGGRRAAPGHRPPPRRDQPEGPGRGDAPPAPPSRPRS